MCGIFCCYKTKNILDNTIRGLQELEFRGYDSSGIFIKGDGTSLLTSTGALKEELYRNHDWPKNPELSLGHVRWASNSKVSKESAHPIEAHNGRMIIVHNGIFEGFGNKTKSDTQEFVEFASKCKFYTEWIEKVRGNNALVLYDNNKSDQLTIYCSGNKRLYLGSNKNGGYFITSSKSSLPITTKEYCMIDNSQGIVKLYSDNKVISCGSLKFKPLEYNYSGRAKSMLQEIEEQPYLFEPKEEKEHILDKPVFVGCGSSYYAGLFASLCWREILLEDSTAEYATEFIPLNDRYIVLISQSGETQDVINCSDNIPYPYSNPEPYVITNTKESHLGSFRNVYTVDAGLETSVAATKTFTATCLKLLQLCVQCDTLRYWKNHEYETFLRTVRKYRKHVEYVISHKKKIRNIVRELIDSNINRYLFLGSGYNYPVALESALKIKEISYRSADGMPSGEVCHGPLALVDGQTLSVFIFTGQVKKSQLKNLNEVQSRNGETFIIIEKRLRECYNIYGDWIIEIPDMIERPYSKPIIALIANIVLQYFAYYTAIECGLNPERPRSLAKSVTV